MTSKYALRAAVSKFVARRAYTTLYANALNTGEQRCKLYCMRMRLNPQMVVGYLKSLGFTNIRVKNAEHPWRTGIRSITFWAVPPGGELKLPEKQPTLPKPCAPRVRFVQIAVVDALVNLEREFGIKFRAGANGRCQTKDGGKFMLEFKVNPPSAPDSVYSRIVRDLNAAGVSGSEFDFHETGDAAPLRPAHNHATSAGVAQSTVSALRKLGYAVEYTEKCSEKNKNLRAYWLVKPGDGFGISISRETTGEPWVVYIAKIQGE